LNANDSRYCPPPPPFEVSALWHRIRRPFPPRWQWYLLRDLTHSLGETLPISEPGFVASIFPLRPPAFLGSEALPLDQPIANNPHPQAPNRRLTQSGTPPSCWAFLKPLIFFLLPVNPKNRPGPIRTSGPRKHSVASCFCPHLLQLLPLSTFPSPYSQRVFSPRMELFYPDFFSFVILSGLLQFPRIFVRFPFSPAVPLATPLLDSLNVFFIVRCIFSPPLPSPPLRFLSGAFFVPLFLNGPPRPFRDPPLVPHKHGPCGSESLLRF